MCDPGAAEPPSWLAKPGRVRCLPARRRFAVLSSLAVVLPLLLHPAPADAQAAKPDPAAARINPGELTAQLNAITEAQRNLAGTLAELRDQLNEAQRILVDLRDEVRQDREAFQAEVEQTKGMREEVRGLYVESSGLKGDIAQLGQRVEAFDESLGSFRLSSGIVVAVVIVLQLVLLGLTFRSHS